MTGDTVRVAFLGARHPHIFPRVELLRERPDVELIGFCEAEPGLAQRLAAATGLRAFGDPAELLAERIDLAVVEGLDPEVPVLARAAARAGARGLLLEKPGAATPSEFFDLADELRALGAVVEVGYELHYSDAVRWCREALRDDVLGQLTLARVHGGCPVGAGAELWQSLPEDLGGLVYTEGSHMIEIMCDLLGEPDRAMASVRRLPPRPAVGSLVYKADLFSESRSGVPVAVGGLQHEDVAAAIFEYPDKIVTFDVTAWEPTTWCAQWAIELYGTNGSLRAIPDPAEVQLTLRSPAGAFGAGTTVLRAPTEPGKRSLIETYRRQLDSLLARLTTGAAAGDPGDPGAAGAAGEAGACGLVLATSTMRVLSATYAAAATGSWVRLDDIARPGEVTQR
jgi:predicted dehydrogenase